jgi:hypothetical protein
MSDELQVDGVVTEILGAAPATWRIEIGGAGTTTHDRGSIQVQTQDGRSIRVDSHGEVQGKPTVEHGGWGELVARAQPRFEAGDTAAFEKASLAVTQIAVGDRVAASGDVVERDAKGNPTRVRASRLARGDDAARVVRRAVEHAKKPPKELGDRIFDGAYWTYMVACGAGAIAWPLFQPGGFRVNGGVSIALVAAILLMLPSASYDLPTFRSRDRTLGGEGMPLTLLRILAGIGALAAVISAGNSGPPNGDLAAACLLALGVLARVMSWSAIGRMHALLGPPWRGGETGAKRVAIRGTVFIPSPAKPAKVGGRSVALGLDAKVEESLGITTSTNGGINYRENATFHAADAIAIECEHGPISVAPNEIAWSTSVNDKTNVKKSGSSQSFTWYELVPVGAAVLASGWVVGTPPRLVARGTQPALLRAADVGGDPTAGPRELGRYWRIMELGLLVLAAGLIAFELVR